MREDLVEEEHQLSTAITALMCVVSVHFYQILASRRLEQVVSKKSECGAAVTEPMENGLSTDWACSLSYASTATLREIY